MRVTLSELMEKLGVGYSLSPYETFPWSHYDEGKEETCSAEVRMGPEGEDVEVEVMMVYDNPPAGKPGFEQLLWMKALPKMQGKWTMSEIRVRQEDYVGKVYDWETKGCSLFRAIVQALRTGSIPNFDELLQREFHSRERYGDKSSSGGGKQPKIRPSQLLDMKKGQGF